jgi:rubrerythrin
VESIQMKNIEVEDISLGRYKIKISRRVKEMMKVKFTRLIENELNKYNLADKTITRLTS